MPRVTQPLDGWRMWAAFFVLFAIIQSPLYLLEYPDIVDFPNHLARLHVLLYGAQSEWLQRYYERASIIWMPNLAMDVITPWLAQYMTLPLALKAFASLSAFMAASGAAALARAIAGRHTYMGLGAVLFSHSAMFQLGLFNYLFSIGLALWLLAAWLLSRHYTYSVARIALFAVGACVVFLGHLGGLALYGIGVIAAEAGSTDKASDRVGKRVVAAALQFLPVAVLYSYLARASAGVVIDDGATSSSLVGVLVYKAIVFLVAPFASTSGYSWSAAILGAAVTAFLYIASRKHVLVFNPMARRMAILLAIMILLLPPSGFGSNMTDIRLVLPLMVIAWIGMVPRVSLGEARVGIFLVTLGVLFTSVTTLSEWSGRQNAYQQTRAALRSVERGAKVAVVLEGTTAISPHVAAFAVVDREVFLSNFYLQPFQPFRVAFHPKYVDLAALARTDHPGAAPPSDTLLQGRFDYLVIVGGRAGSHDPYAGQLLYASHGIRIVRTSQQAE